MFWTKHCFTTIERHICRTVCYEQPLPRQTRDETLCPAHLDGWAQGVPPRGCPPRPLPPLPGQTQNPMLCPTSMDWPRVCPFGDAHSGPPPGEHETLCSAPPRWMGQGCAPLGMPTQAHCHHSPGEHETLSSAHLDGWAQGVPPRGCPPRPTATTPGRHICRIVCFEQNTVSLL